MLTKTQLRTAKTSELERLQQRIATELEERQHDKGKQREAPDPKDQLFYSGHTGTYRWEHVTCGHSERCRKCQSGKKHGVRTCTATFTKTPNREASTSSFQISISARTHRPDLCSFPAPLVLSYVLRALSYPMSLHRTTSAV